MIIVEAAVWDADMNNKHSPMYEMALEGIPLRKHTWPSRNAARAYFGKKLPWTTWDKRVFEAFIVSENHILSDLGR